MEILSGMILLLQVVISIQIMLMGKQMLQRLGALEGKIDSEKKYVDNLTEMNKEEGTSKASQAERKLLCEAENYEVPEKIPENIFREELLNEVLSEVFS